MAYPVINSRRMPYDIDGTAVGYNDSGGLSPAGLIPYGIASWLNSVSAGNLNKADRSQVFSRGSDAYGCGTMVFWFFFPEIREITHLGFLLPDANTVPTSLLIQGSTDTTNGVDGTWEDAVFSLPAIGPSLDNWRSKVFPVSFSGPMKEVRIGMYSRLTSPWSTLSINALHLYGRKAAGQTPDDILFTDINGNEITSVTDWGDQPEGTEELWWFKLKNASTTKIANAVNLQLNHADFSIALSPDGPWVAVLDITSIAANSLSSTIYVRNKLGPPLLTLGPRQARCIVTVGSWT